MERGTPVPKSVGHHKEWKHDPAGRVTQVDGRYAGTVSVLMTRALYERDELGRVRKRTRKVVDNGNETGSNELVLYLYNRRHQLVEQRHPLERGVKIAYDAVGRASLVRDKIDTTGIGPGNESVYEYEAVTGRLARRKLRDVVAADFGIPPASSTLTEQEMEYGYGLLDRVTSVKRKAEVGSTVDPAEITQTYAYDSFEFEVR